MDVDLIGLCDLVVSPAQNIVEIRFGTRYARNPSTVDQGQQMRAEVKIGSVRQQPFLGMQEI